VSTQLWMVLDQDHKPVDNIAFTSSKLAIDSMKLSYRKMHDVVVATRVSTDEVTVHYTQPTGERNRKVFYLLHVHVSNEVTHIQTRPQPSRMLD
jgi:hypothetical protein